MSAWQLMVPQPEPKVSERQEVSQVYGHCYDTEAGERLRVRRALAPLRAAAKAAAELEIEYRGRGRKERRR